MWVQVNGAAPHTRPAPGHKEQALCQKQFTGSGSNNRKLSDEDRAEIVRLYTTSLPDGTWVGVTTIARMFGVSNNCIQYRLKREGVKFRNAKEAHGGGKRCKPVKNLPVGDAPSCKCGCGDQTDWNQRKNRWNVFVEGHYCGAARLLSNPPPDPRGPGPKRKPFSSKYGGPEWLRAEYVERRRTIAEIAEDCGVTTSTIRKAMKRNGVPARDISECHVGRMIGDKNPAWKGGVADWDYAAGWKVIARRIRDRDEWTCQDCDEQRKRWGHSLHVHHIDGNKLNNDPTNLISLCALCHRNAHRKEVVPK